MPTRTAPVHIWRIDLSCDRDLILSPAEVARAARFRFEADRQHWSRAHSALRVILSSYAAIPPLKMDFAVGEHGKPYLDHPSAPHFNLSHSGDWALIAVCLSHPVGVDVERIRGKVDIGALLQRLGEFDLPAGHDDRFLRWAHREARSKASGGPLMTPPPDDAFSIPLEVAAGYAAAVALIGSIPVPQNCPV